MRSVFAVLSLLAVAVSAGPLVFDDHLLKHGDVEGRLAVLHHVSHHFGEEDKPVGHVFGASVPVLRLLFLLPKFAKVVDLSKDGFGSKHFGEGHAPKLHGFLTLHDGDLLVDLLALSNCRTWHAVFVKVWNHSVGNLHHKLFTGLRGHDGKLVLAPVTAVHDLVTFVVTHVHSKEHLHGLLKKGVVAHVFTHHLLAHLKLVFH